MSREREITWPNPTIDQAINASMMVGNHYGSTFSKIDVGEPVEPEDLTDREAEQRLLDLADHVMDGAVTSHVAVAKVVRSLGHKIGPMGSVSTEIDLAAYRVAHAVFQKQGSFVENPPANS